MIAVFMRAACLPESGLFEIALEQSSSMKNLTYVRTQILHSLSSTPNQLSQNSDWTIHKTAILVLWAVLGQDQAICRLHKSVDLNLDVLRTVVVTDQVGNAQKVAKPEILVEVFEI